MAGVTDVGTGEKNVEQQGASRSDGRKRRLQRWGEMRRLRCGKHREEGAVQNRGKDPALTALWRTPLLSGLPSLSISPTFLLLLLCGVFTLRDHSTRPSFGLSGFCCLAKGKPSAVAV